MRLDAPHIWRTKWYMYNILETELVYNQQTPFQDYMYQVVLP